MATRSVTTIHPAAAKVIAEAAVANPANRASLADLCRRAGVPLYCDGDGGARPARRVEYSTIGYEWDGDGALSARSGAWFGKKQDATDDVLGQLNAGHTTLGDEGRLGRPMYVERIGFSGRVIGMPDEVYAAPGALAMVMSCTAAQLKTSETTIIPLGSLSAYPGPVVSGLASIASDGDAEAPILAYGGDLLRTGRTLEEMQPLEMRLHALTIHPVTIDPLPSGAAVANLKLALTCWLYGRDA